MRQKYLVLVCFLFSVVHGNSQWLPLYNYFNFGADTVITCIDASDGYTIYYTTLWVGTNKGVFSIKDGQPVTVFDTANSSLTSNTITAIDEDNDQQNVWVGTNHGLCRLFLWDTTWTCFATTNSSLPSDSITCILAFREDSVWIGTKSGLVLYVANPDTFILFDQSNSELPGNHVQCLERLYGIPYFYYPEPLFIGTDSGMAILKGTQWSKFNISNSGLLSNDIRSIALSAENPQLPNVWIATYGGGVSHLYDTTWTSFTRSNSLIKSDSLDFIENVELTVTGSLKDSLYLAENLWGNSIDTFRVVEYPPLFGPITGVSRFRGNGFWLWVTNNHEIYRADMTEGIFNPEMSQASWQATIIRNQLYLFNLPSSQQFLALNVYDVLGNLVLKRQFLDHSSSENFEIPSLSDGIYLVTLQRENQIEAVKTAKTE